MIKEYFLYVRYSLSGLKVYKVKTDNLYRIIGKIYCSSIEKIDRIDYSLFSVEKEHFILIDGLKIIDYKEPKLFLDYYNK